MSIENGVNTIDIDIHKLPYMESLYKQAKDEVDKMQRTRQETENYLHNLNDEIASAKALLNYYHISCERKRQESENLNNDISRSQVLVARFKSNNEEYLKIEKTVEEKVKSVLTDNKQILQFALASIIESIGRNPDKYNDLLVGNASLSSTPAQYSLLSHIEGCKDAILEAADKLYDILLKHFTNSIMENAVGSSPSNSKLSLPSSSSFPNLSDQSDTYRIEDLEIYNNKGCYRYFFSLACLCFIYQ
jgi:hypothetical protein